ncbi:type VI secretion protein ImpB [Blastopirellula sp. J2-11]|uniref:Y-family DNA polymerase n=1 Tax=Blastopirellula sp. J2-11 TaxID=2943192 RepID=UPI0021C63481|nr:type VI secretion protein ImpB [Blastopirellula sp. J2-11]UUO05718.1 type VI secretion protein ImpB [Blastopirellula sp. J2-11]
MEAMNWLWMDMNSYFASVEQQLRPELRKQPVGVVPLDTDRTCIIAASYDAKRFGVKVGTKVYDARRLCPGIQLIKARPDVYVKMHHRLLASVEKCAPIERIYSIDEWTIRLLGADRQLEQARRLAYRIKRQVAHEIGLWMSCSIGIAASRLLAKIAAGLEKPHGLTALPQEALPERIEHLSLTKLNGVNVGIERRLNQHGVTNVRELWNLNRDEMTRAWGSISGSRWWAGLHGIDEPEPPTRRQSMSHGNVLDPQFRTAEGAHCILVKLICKLAQRLRRSGYFANVLQLSLKDVRGGRFETKTPIPCLQDTPSLLLQFEKLWKSRPVSNTPLLKVDVCVSDLRLASQVTRSLFQELEQPCKLSAVLDEITDRWGPSALFFGSIHRYQHAMEEKIAFGRIPENRSSTS